MKNDAGRMLDVIRSFRDRKVLVIGDVMVDAYLWGRVDRISPEAPVPIVTVNDRKSRLGGAANVAINLKSLGAQAFLCTVIGDDIRGKEFLALLAEEGLPSHGIIQSKERVTTTKFRVIGNNIQMLRVDEEIDRPLSRKDESSLLEMIRKGIDDMQIDVIIFEDYDKGCVTADLTRKVIDLAHRNGIKVAVDPKFRNFQSYKGADLFKPNLKEMREGLQMKIDATDASQIKEAADLCHDTYNHGIVLLTLSDHGILVSEGRTRPGRKSVHFPAQIRQISDVSGAGDTVISVASLGMASGMSAPDLAWLANLAGGIVCEQLGVVPIDPELLAAEVNKLYQSHQL